MNTNKYPNSKNTNLVVQVLENEILIYNLSTNKAFCLNSTTAFIWKNSDGNTNITQLVGLFNSEFNLQVKEDFIWLALDELYKFELIENHSLQFENPISRRKVLLNYGLPMILFPMITSVIAPLAVNAQSGGCVSDPLATCSSDANCNAGNTQCPINCACNGFVCNLTNNCCIPDPALITCIR